MVFLFFGAKKRHGVRVLIDAVPGEDIRVELQTNCTRMENCTEGDKCPMVCAKEEKVSGKLCKMVVCTGEEDSTATDLTDMTDTAETSEEEDEEVLDRTTRIGKVL
ncbi:hypothetical protein CEXT_693191 [Caerostris extrusa]|uniref:Uncharacterized protein n=1 Tax=Caerostris extrusa TaxID=172846 RepID=A0AAV4Y4J4_CAEEX|nr:hypothetical protein CEXT_693191 [Caerostris extrusa]